MSTEKKVTKKSQGDAIFAQELAKRATGAFDSNKAFRSQVIDRMVAEIDGVGVASGAAMYNQAKKAAEAADSNVNLGRDPKKVVVKAKPAAVVVVATAPVAEEETA